MQIKIASKDKSGNYIVWMLDNTSKDSLIASEEYDCSNLRYRLVMLHSITIIMEKGKIGSYDTEQLKSIGKYNWVYPTQNTYDSKVNWVCRN